MTTFPFWKISSPILQMRNEIGISKTVELKTKIFERTDIHVTDCSARNQQYWKSKYTLFIDLIVVNSSIGSFRRESTSRINKSTIQFLPLLQDWIYQYFYKKSLLRHFSLSFKSMVTAQPWFDNWSSWCRCTSNNPRIPFLSPLHRWKIGRSVKSANSKCDQGTCHLSQPRISSFSWIDFSTRGWLETTHPCTPTSTSDVSLGWELFPKTALKSQNHDKVTSTRSQFYLL